MKQNMAASNITLREAPIENRRTIGIVERFQATLRIAYNPIRLDVGNNTTKEYCLALFFRAVNSTVSTEGLFPVLLCFGEIPRPARNRPSPMPKERAQAIKGGSGAAQKEESRRRLSSCAGDNKEPKAIATSERLRKLPDKAALRGMPHPSYYTCHTTKRIEVHASSYRWRGKQWSFTRTEVELSRIVTAWNPELSVSYKTTWQTELATHGAAN